MIIHYLKNTEIITSAWDKCIAGSFNGTLYACSWYLDLISEQWDALVEDDYKSVMPLIIKKRWGQEMIDLPGFAPELGIFSKEPINAEKTRQFLDSIPPGFRYFRITLNKFNPLETRNITVRYQKKYELDLIEPYYKLSSDFKPALRSKLNLAMAHRFNMIKGLSPNDLIQFIIRYRIPTEKTVSDHNYRLLRTIIAGLIRYKSGELFGVYNNHNQLASIVMLSWFTNRLYLQFQVTDPDQQQNFPHLFLIDRIIEKYAETHSTLTFEFQSKSSNPFQFTDFDARESQLIEIVHNRLPCFLKWLPLW
jgi:hypothetical protein